MPESVRRDSTQEMSYENSLRTFEIEMGAFDVAYQNGEGDMAVWYLLRANGELGKIIAICHHDGHGVQGAQRQDYICKMLHRIVQGHAKIIRGRERLFGNLMTW